MRLNPAEPIQGIAFDLLTALLDSWTLWVDIAGNEEIGRRWRMTSLIYVTGAGQYRSYEAVVEEAARDVGLSPSSAGRLLSSWDRLKPWPDVFPELTRVKEFGVPLAVLTNCSQSLAEKAAKNTAIAFDHIISAEKAGFYKIEPAAYLAVAQALGAAPERVLFVAGSAHDVLGAGRVGMPVYWTNRHGLRVPAGASEPRFNENDLKALPSAVGGALRRTYQAES